jgi:ELWxxDGT repeat protein
MVKDINPGSGSDNATDAINLGGTLFFTADDGSHGTELWRSDGTPTGTKMVKDINPTGSSDPPSGGGTARYELTSYKGMLIFRATDGAHGVELWKSDGTAAGTKMVKDINPGGADSFPYGFTNVGSTLFFFADDGTHGAELWKTNGTAAGTKLVKDIRPGSDQSFPTDGESFKKALFFTANDGVHGSELWKSNGTAAGTKMVKDIRHGSAGSQDQMAQKKTVGNTLFFGADDGTHGIELWKTDGTAAGTKMVKDINPGSGPSPPLYPVYASYEYFFTNLNGTLFFDANDTNVMNPELWKSDGTAAGTKPLGSGSPFSLTPVGGRLFFNGSDGHGMELWKSDGTPPGTKLVKDINPGSGDSNPTYLIDAAGIAFFFADDGTHGDEPWQSDGTAGGTKLVKDINPGSAGSHDTGATDSQGFTFQPTPVNVNGTVFFFADDGKHGEELWGYAIAADTSKPTIAIKKPADGAHYEKGQKVKADYHCSDPDGASDVRTCTGTLPNGARIDTSKLGRFSFKVNASDKAGNTATKTVHYFVCHAGKCSGNGGGGNGGGGNGGGGNGGNGGGKGRCPDDQDRSSSGHCVKEDEDVDEATALR